MTTWFTVALDTHAPMLHVGALTVVDSKIDAWFTIDDAEANVAATFIDFNRDETEFVLVEPNHLQAVLPEGSTGAGVVQLLAVDDVLNLSSLEFSIGDYEAPDPVGHRGQVERALQGMLNRAREGALSGAGEPS